MADIVRILGLDDDNHAPMFRMETGEIFSTPRELIEFLSRSHDVEYQVKMFAIVDGVSEGLGLADYNQDDIDTMFGYLEGLYVHPKEIVPVEDFIFELFWDAANRKRW
jgi:hypothetical protein